MSHDKKGILIDPEIISILEEFSSIAGIAIDNAKLFESQKLEFEKRIAHDFNNILSAIMGFTQIAMDDAQKGSRLEEDLNEVYTASLRAKDLVQQILTFARQSAEPVNAVKVSLIVKELLKFIRSSIPSTINIKQNIKSTSKIIADPTQLYQVFLNLFTNASQAMEKDGGTLEVEIIDEVLEEARESLLPGRYIRIKISDTGIGIGEEQIHHIYEPYFTTKQMGEGTGLGLAVVHGAVKSMKGEIFVESKPGQGTMFILYLPIAHQKDSGQGYDYNDEDLPSGKQEHILFVDDEISITKLGKRMLDALNYKVTTMNSRLEALDFFRSGPDIFRAVITDMTMPHMTGDILAEALKKIRPDIPIILCTGFSKYISDKNLAEKGINYYCRKPISKAELAGVVRNAIDDKHNR